MVFVCNNNGWDTSVPARLQAAGPSIAVRAQAYGFPGTDLDGCDSVEVYKASKASVDCVTLSVAKDQGRRRGLSPDSSVAEFILSIGKGLPQNNISRFVRGS